MRVFRKLVLCAAFFIAGTQLAAADPDTAVYNFETDAQGWTSNGESIVTVAQSTAQAFAGTGSLAIQIDDSGFASVRVVSPSVQAGQLITFHIYLPAEAGIDWVQPFVQEGGTGGWHAQWTPIEGLQLGAWNTLSVYVPADAQTLDAVGLELYVSDSSAGTVYVDSVSAVTVPDTAAYHFETDTQGWVSNGEPIIAVAQSTARKFVGEGSLALEIDSAGFASVRVPNTVALAGATLTFHVYIPANAPIDWIQPFAQSSTEWHGNWASVGGLQAGAWNTITVEVPAGSQPVEFIGLELYVSEAYEGTVYIDSVSY